MTSILIEAVKRIEGYEDNHNFTVEGAELTGSNNLTLHVKVAGEVLNPVRKMAENLEGYTGVIYSITRLDYDAGCWIIHCSVLPRVSTTEGADE